MNDIVTQGMNTAPEAFAIEQILLGCMLMQPGAVERVSDKLNPDDFFYGQHQDIYAAILELSALKLAIELPILTEKLKSLNKLDSVGGIAYLAGLAAGEGNASNVMQYTEIVREKSSLRKMIALAKAIESKAITGNSTIDQLVGDAQQSFLALLDKKSNQTVDLKEVIPPVVDGIEDRSVHGFRGMSTDFTDLDYKLGGFSGGYFVVIAGRPSMGKTAFGMQVALNKAIENKRVLVFTMEMTKEQIVERFISQVVGIDSTVLRSGNLSNEDWERLAVAVGKLNDLPLKINDRGALTIQQIAAQARLMFYTDGLDLIVIDYLQLIGYSGKSSNRQEQISEISREMKALAKELDIPVIVLSQLNRAVESRQDKRPVMSDLRESGAIEQDADVVMFLYRDEYYNPDSMDKGVAEVILSKNRNGSTGSVRLIFEKECTRFRDGLSVSGASNASEYY